MIAKMQCAKVIDRFLDAGAGADDENANGFGDRCTGDIDPVSNIHQAFSLFSLSGGLQKAKKLSDPTVESLVGSLV
jgi:hypothetical protein